MFNDDLFTYHPDFIYIEVSYMTKLLGVIIVGQSKGKGRPCCVNSSHRSSPKLTKQLIPNQLWYREGCKNKTCVLGQPITQHIFEWFSSRTSIIKGSTKRNPVQSFQEINRLFCNAVHNFKSGHFVLILGPCSNSTRHLKALADIPWIFVFDFDTESRKSGALSICENIISNRRSFYLSTWTRLPTALSTDATHWCMIRGFQDEDNSMVEDDAKKWYKKTRDSIDNYCKQIAKFMVDVTVIRPVIIWDEDETYLPHLLYLLRKLSENLEVEIGGEESQPDIVFCMPNVPQSEKGNRAYRDMRDEFNFTHVHITPEQVFLSIEDIQPTASNGAVKNHSIPTTDDSDDPDISDRDAAWLKEDLDVLYMSELPPMSVGDFMEEEEQFYKGASLPWDSWYSSMGNGHFDIQRDIASIIINMIRKFHIKDHKDGLITLYHAPGAGGTTIAQRVLWELHTETPCIQLKTNTGSSLEDVITKIHFIYDKSGLQPIVIMIDGDDENRVRRCHQMTHNVCGIILYVKRYPYPMKRDNTIQRFWLSGSVSCQEGNLLASKYSVDCDRDKKEAIISLADDVKKGRQHHLYEFGLAKYLHEYKGVRRYVRGYLMLDETVNEMYNWQKLLGYLALTHYYGHEAIPCQFFVTLLGKPVNWCVSIDDIPAEAREFIVEDTHGGPNYIRISHYIVAKEILEQLLNPRDMRDHGNDEQPESFSMATKGKLADFAIEFIKYAGNNKLKSRQTSLHVRYILTRTFIYRDNQLLGSKEAYEQLIRPLMSQILYDIESKPPYEERMLVLKQLTISFPDNPEFHAHLGRFYAYFLPELEAEAESCLEKALSKCSQDDHQTLKNVYHMYGMVYLRRISQYTGAKLGDRPPIHTDQNYKGNTPPESEFHTIAQKLVGYAHLACQHFTDSRQHIQCGEDESIGYAIVGEMTVRLRVCDYVDNYFLPDGCRGYLHCNNADTEMADFIKDSPGILDYLIMEYYMYINERHDDSFVKNVNWYNTLFKDPKMALDKWTGTDDLSTRRMWIAAYKLKYTKGKDTADLDAITN